MKRFLFCIFLTGLSFSMFAQTYLDVNFDSGIPANFQLNNGGDSQSESWFGVNSYVESGQAKTLNGTPFLFCNGDPVGPGNNMDEYLTTPLMNTASASQVFLQFIQYYRDYTSTPTDTGIIEVFDGSDWVKVLAQTTNSGSWTQPKLMRINLTPYKNPAMRIRFHFLGEWPWWWAIDNLRVYVPQAKDIGPSAVVAPTTDCNLGDAVTLKVKIANYGTANQTNFPVSYSVNGGTPVTQNYTANLVAGNSADFTFTTPLDISTSGVYKVNFWTGLAGDGAADNDSLKGFVVTQFKNGFTKQEFTIYDGSNLSDVSPGWKEARGLKGEGLVSNWTKSGPLQQAFFGSVSAKLNLLGNTQKEWIVTPSFVPTSETGLIFKCAVTDWNSGQSDNMGSDDSLKIRISTNCGTTWRTLFFLNSSSGLNNQFKTFIIPLTQYSGQEIRIGFYATEGNVNNDEDYDIHLDDIELKTLPPKDLGVTAIVNPVTGCGLANTQVKVTIRNFGSKTQRQFPVNLKVNNQPVLTETFVDSIVANQSKDFTFSVPSNIGNPGIYNFISWTGLVGDANSFNDSIKNYSIENSIAITSFPYNQNFENGDGGWKIGGTLPSWALGNPQKSIINSPAEGLNSWTTGGLGTGTYNSNEKSFVLAPCFNFTSLVNPVIEMKVWWHSEFSTDGAVLQYSINGGQNWFNVGAFGDPNNWYNDNTVFAVSPLANPQHAWTGGVNANQNGSEGWVTCRNFLKGLAGKPLVKLRVLFGSNATVSGDGFAFDDVKIYESPLKDAELVSIVSPASDGCGYSGSQAVRIKISNKGRQPLTNVPVRFKLNNFPQVNEVIAGPIDTNSSIVYTFSSTVDLSEPGVYDFNFSVDLPDDGILGNNSINAYKVKVYNNAIDTVSFSAFNGVNLNQSYLGWKESRLVSPQGSISGWTNSNVVQESFFGSRTAKVYLFANVTKEWMISPQINCEETTKLGFKLAKTSQDLTANATMGGDDSLAVMVSADCGSTWEPIYLFTRDSVITNSFRSYRISLSAFAGQKILIGFYATDGSINSNNGYELHLDNIYVLPSPAKDLAAIGLVQPVQSCGLTSTQQIRLKVFNNGSQAASSFQINFRLNNQAIVSQTINESLFPDESNVYTFTTTANFSVNGTYRLKAWVSFPGDLVNENDTATTQFAKFGTPTQLFNFNGYNGANISSIYKGWEESRGDIPAGSQSGWDALAIGSNTVAKVFISGASIKEWLISPPIKLGNSAKIQFKAGLRFPNTNIDGSFDTDDRIRILLTTNCGQNWIPVKILDDTLQPALTAGLQQYQVDLSAYENQEVRFAFQALDGTRADKISEFILDDISVISLTNVADVGLVQFVSPTEQLISGQPSPIKIRLQNFGNATLPGLSLLKVKIGLNSFAAYVPNPLAPGTFIDLSIGDYTPTGEGVISACAYIKLLPGGDGQTSNDTICQQITITGVHDNLVASKLKIYPNPASSELWVKADKGIDQDFEFRIVNFLGQTFSPDVVFEDESLMRISLSSIPAGIYNLILKSGGKSSNARFVVK